MSSSNVRDRRREERKIWKSALLGSLLFHVLLFVGSGRRSIPPLPESSSGPNEGDLRAARGGVQTMRISIPPPRPITPPALPLPTEIEVEEFDLDTEVDFDLAALLGDPGPPGPPGLEGEGEGDGGTGENGQMNTDPKPRGLIPPPMDKRLRNVTVTVWVFINESGRVVADSTRLDPPTKNRKLNRKLIEEAAEWRFIPGTRNGQPVAAWTRYTIGMS
ncbi:MAG: energy transducer TonB [Gemmatimonadota bacterium]|nr:energy transducer TonB [Gemmatimonadota bacterium]MDE2873028.1 energy transducer TonB [Gemmatimonadota bacterium]